MKTFMQDIRSTISGATWVFSFIFACGVGVGLLLSSVPAIAQEPDVPWECSGYSGEAQTRCIKTLLELQQEKMAKLEEQLKAQERTLNDLKEKMERQEAVTGRDAQAYQQDSGYPRVPYVPAYAYPYGPSYGYGQVPPIGIYVQPPWRYPRYYGYGPGYWGRPGFGFNFRFGGGHRHHHR